MKRSQEKLISFLLIAIMLVSAFSAFTIGIAGNQVVSEPTGTEPVFVSGDSLHYNLDGRTGVVPGTSGDIVSSVKYIQEGNDIYLIYQDYSIRWGNVRYMEYKDGTWSEPTTVGHDYSDMIRNGGRSYIVSSDLEKVFLTIADGNDMQTLHLADGRIVATSIGVVDGYVTPFWADIHGDVYSASEQNWFSSPSQIYHTGNSVYRLSYDNGLNVVERKDGMTVNTLLSRSSDGWSVKSQNISGAGTRSAGSADETKTIDDEFHQRQNETGKWVMIVYLNGDNNLGDNGGLGGGEYDVGDLNEMESAYDNSSLGKFDIVVLWDHKGSDDPDTHVLWLRHDTNGAETKDSTDTVKSPKIDSHFPLLANTNELYMSNYTVFVNFTEWAVNNFPAEHYFVDMWDHGGDYQGVIWDDNAGSDTWPRDHITIEDMHNATLAIHDDLYPILGRTLDIIGYDTCLTQHGGIQYHNKIMFDFVGASEHTEGGYGWSYDTVLDEMVNTQGNITAEKQAYNLAHEVNADGGIVTYAVVNTTLWDYKWMPAYNALAQAMKHKAGTENKGITDAFSNSETADSSNWKTAHDYWDLINNHIIGDGEISDSDILYWAHRCVENMTHNTTDTFIPGKLIPCSYDSDTKGKKLMMADSTDKDEVNNYKAQAWIFQENQWDEMINQVDANADVNNAVPTVTLDNPHDGDHIPRADGSVTINGTAADSDGSVQKVQIKIDREYWINASGTDSWSYTWDISNVPFGWHHIMARSYDGTDFSNEWPGIWVDIIPNSPPTVSLDYPSSNDIVSGTVPIQWTASDPDNDTLSVDLYYSADGGNTWNTIATGEDDDGSYLWDTTGLSDGVDYKVMVNVTDPVPQTASDVSDFFSIDNTVDDQWYMQIEAPGVSGYYNLSMEPVENSAWGVFTNITDAGQFSLGKWMTHTFSADKTIAGNWTFNVWGRVTDVTATGGHLYANIYSYDGNTTTLLYTTAEDDEDISDYGSYHQFSWNDTASGKFDAGSSIIVELMLNATSGSSSSTAYSYANGESTAYGDKSGDYSDTSASDDSYETLSELAGGTGLGILSADFEGGLPSGWTIDNEGTGGGWAIDGSSTSSGNWVYDDSDAAGSGKTQDDYLYTPIMDCGTYTTVTLSFYHDYKHYQETSDEGGFVDVSNDSGSTWTNVYHIYDTDVKETRTIDISSIAAGYSQVQVRWHYIAGYDYHWGIDDVNITGNRPSLMEHTWTFDIGDGGTDASFEVEAYHDSNSEGDDFAFYYSSDNSSFTQMLTVTKTSDDDTVQTYSLPSNISGTVYVKAVDTNRDESNGNSDSLYVDYMAMKVTKGAPQFVLAFDGMGCESNVIPSIADPPTIDVSFQSGWNLISLPWLTSPTNIEDALNGVSWDRAMIYQNGQWYTYNKNRDAKFNLGFPDADNTMGIWVHSTSDYTLTGPGDDIGSTTITLHKGWNLVGYASGTERSVGDVFSGISYDHLETFDGTSIVDVSGNMLPGTGYWVYVSSEQAWTVDW